MSNGAPGQQAPQQQQQVPAQGPQGGQKPQGGGKAKRRMRNFLLQPLLQVKLGLYAILMSIGFAAALGGIIYHNFAGLVTSIVLLTDAEDEVRELFMDYWHGTQLWIYLVFAVYIIGMVILSVLYMHKLVGPTYAFRRHIRSLAEGRYNARTYLRKGDAFLEVADELNRLSEVMEKTKGQPHNLPK